ASRGYAAAFGWIQLVCSTDDPSSRTAFEPDPLALLRDVNTPYAFFGIKPTLFDAPFRTDRADLRWRAQSFLCFSPNAVTNKQVHAATGFSWGFHLRSGEFSFHSPRELAAGDWDDHLPLLSTRYPSWTFHPGFRSA